MMLKYLVTFLLLLGILTTKAQNQSYTPGFADLHNSALYRLFVTQNTHGLDDHRFAVNLQAIRQLNTRLMVFSIGIPRFSMRHPDTVRIEQLVVFLQKFKTHIQQKYPDFQFIDDTPKDTNKIRWMFALEGTHLLKGKLHWVDSLHRAGVRMIGLAHWFHNHFIVNPHDTAYQQRAPERINDQSVLSPRGRALVKYLISKNIWLDVSHLRHTAFTQVVALNQRRTPLIASHSNAYGVCPNSRNLTDAQMKAIVDSGGLIGVCLHRPLIAQKDKVATLGKLVDHIQYLIKVAGNAHVAIGTDLEGLIRPPKSLNRLEYLTKIAQEMQKRGIKATVIEQVMWQNAVRVLGGN
ncbi:MAG TPA: hypothetical protein DCS93_00145 [Microscillaceae bacterium]|nr:hypothetical protein [Microscillaceae bacterium]